MAAVLGISLLACRKDAGTSLAKEVAPTYERPPPVDTICGVSVEPIGEPFTINVGEPSIRAVVNTTNVARSMIEPQLRGALIAVLQCGDVHAARLTLVVDMYGKVTVRAEDAPPCIVAPFAKLTLVGPTEIVIDLETSEAGL
jgi:hypothetical protein